MKTGAKFESTVAAREELLRSLPQLHQKSAQLEFLSNHPQLLHSETVSWLSDLSRDQARIDVSRALPLAEMAMEVATKLPDKVARARSYRAMGNALHVSGQNKDASTYHEKARQLFKKAEDRNEVARTLSASIQPLILMGKYDRALANAREGRRIFTALKDHWRLARLDINTGNIFHRQDRFSEALKWYRKSHKYLITYGEKDPEAMGVALHNIAMCKVSLNDFQGAFAAHQEARAFADEHGMPLLVAQSDYNIATLHYMRGEYSRALRILIDTLDFCKKVKDEYHVGLCHLDLSEIYLQLNLNEPAEEMAREASAEFQKLGMGYEIGRSLVNLALALGRQDKSAPALELLTTARRNFVEEKNFAWPALTDFYRAIIMTRQQRYREALVLGRTVNRFFRVANIPDKLASTELLLAQLQLLTGNLSEAEKACSRALDILKPASLPILACQAEQLMGRIQLSAGLYPEAYWSYQEARRLLEATRSGLLGDEVKISFMQDKLEVYECLVQLCIEPTSGYYNFKEAFHYIEQSKSRSLQNLSSLAEISDSSPDRTSEAQQQAKELRAEINYYSRKLAEEQLRDREASQKALDDAQSAIRKREKQLLRLTREMPSAEAEPAGLFSAKALKLEQIRAALPADSTLIEYFQIQNTLYAAVVTRTALDITPLLPVTEVTELVEHLEFQLSKFRLGPDYAKTFGDSLLRAAQRHLKELRDKLISPLENKITGQHLVIVPHGILHHLPFQAFYDGQKYLVDKFTISYAPSATVHALCHNRPVKPHGNALVMGVADARAPLILDEATTVAGMVPHAELLLNENATTSALESKGAHCSLIHIATHGYYRQDSPMFSGIRLGDSILSLYDLYQFRLPVNLITLSGCSTGVSTVAEGDELLGLVRGLLRAGARATLLTLWDVQDRSTLDFMINFYRHLAAGTNMAVSLQQAAFSVREQYQHPYYWAPFRLVGNVFP